ncbi:MAG TPA: hypothetical protein VM198_05185 [Longimicrobiales bacterium]|nr:hypothetical protein [Longimicrobiales bacterium]
MRTTVDIDPHLLRRLRDEAAQEGVSFKDALNRALRRGFERAHMGREPYECPTFGMGTPLRPLDKALALADALEDEEVARKLSLRE